MTYNVFHFFVNMKNECKCANKWQKYFIYAQGINTSLATLQMVFGVSSLYFYHFIHFETVIAKCLIQNYKLI